MSSDVNYKSVVSVACLTTNASCMFFMSNVEKPAEPDRARGKEGWLRQLAKAFIYCSLI